MAYADSVNQAFDAAQPWVIAKTLETATAEQRAGLQDVCSRALAGFKALSIMLTPVLPAVTRRVSLELFGGQREYTWADASIVPTHVAPFKHLMQRVDPNVLENLFDKPDDAGAGKASTSATGSAAGSSTVVAAGLAASGSPVHASTDAGAPAPGGEAIAPVIGIDDFVKIDLRVARIVQCEEVPDSKKLLKLTLDVGEGRHRTVFSGIK